MGIRGKKTKNYHKMSGAADSLYSQGDLFFTVQADVAGAGTVRRARGGAAVVGWLGAIRFCPAISFAICYCNIDSSDWL